MSTFEVDALLELFDETADDEVLVVVVDAVDDDDNGTPNNGI